MEVEVQKEHTTTAPDKTILVCLHACKSASLACIPENPKGLGKHKYELE